jgi:hypothetical protein
VNFAVFFENPGLGRKKSYYQKERRKMTNIMVIIIVISFKIGIILSGDVVCPAVWAVPPRPRL